MNKLKQKLLSITSISLVFIATETSVLANSVETEFILGALKAYRVEIGSYTQCVSTRRSVNGSFFELEKACTSPPVPKNEALSTLIPPIVKAQSSLLDEPMLTSYIRYLRPPTNSMTSSGIHNTFSSDRGSTYHIVMDSIRFELATSFANKQRAEERLAEFFSAFRPPSNFERYTLCHSTREQINQRRESNDQLPSSWCNDIKSWNEVVSSETIPHNEQGDLGNLGFSKRYQVFWIRSKYPCPEDDGIVVMYNEGEYSAEEIQEDLRVKDAQYRERFNGTEDVMHDCWKKWTRRQIQEICGKNPSEYVPNRQRITLATRKQDHDDKQLSNMEISVFRSCGVE